MEKLITKLMAWCERTGRVLKITGTAGPDDVYLIRYYLIKSRFVNIFIHQFLRSDRDDLHDHPWNFATYLVRGAYTENKYNFETGQIEKTRRVNKKSLYSYSTRENGLDSRGYPNIESFNENYRSIKLNTFVTRKATDRHQVVVDRDLKESEKDQAALTLFISGPTKRDWGFVKDGTWVNWKKYLGLPDDTPGRG